MTLREFGRTPWTKKELVKSILYFALHFFILMLIVASVMLSGKLSNFGAYMKEHAANYVYAFFGILLLIVIMFFYFFFEDKEMIAKGKNVAMLFVILEVYFLLAWFIGLLNIYARPVALVGLLVYMLAGRKNAIFMNIVSALFIFIVDTFVGNTIASANEYYSSLIISFSAGMIAIFFCSYAKSRLRVVFVGMLIVIPIDLIIFLLEFSTLLDGEKTVQGISDFQGIIVNMGFGLFGGVMSAVIFLSILPLFELGFNRLTPFRLRELTSSDATILKKLKEEAPGTYNHSIMVSQLAEACAAALGEDVDVARAAALYHDVGKLHNPEHFTENQGEYNLHDELSPELSADIIRSHAKDGYTLIKNHHLPDFLADVAIQHHGTLPIRYFYAKALKMTDAELNIEDFSYLGPKPQTKIAAIIMIADASEAAVRAKGARAPEDVEKVIRAVIEERMNMDQFSECNITLAELTKIRHALVNALSGVYHHRIKYPNLRITRTENGAKGERD